MIIAIALLAVVGIFLLIVLRPRGDTRQPDDPRIQRPGSIWFHDTLGHVVEEDDEFKPPRDQDGLI
jgi:hypothetical protein